MKHWDRFYETTGHPAHYRADEDRLDTHEPFATDFIVFFFTHDGRFDARFAEQTLPNGAIPVAVGTESGIFGYTFPENVAAARELWAFWFEWSFADRAQLALDRARKAYELR